MLRITYAPEDIEVAESLQAAFANAQLQAEKDTLIVLISPESNADLVVQATIREALDQSHRILPVIIRETSIPAAIAHLEPIDFTLSVQPDTILKRLQNVVTRDTRQKNRWALALMSAIVLLMFFLSILGVGGGMIGFPEDEYEADAATEAAIIDKIIGPTLTALQPQTTQDAINLAPTIEAMPTRIRPFYIMTATALPQQGE